MTLEMRISKS